MQLSEQQLNTPLSKLTVKDFVKIIGEINLEANNLDKDDFFKEWLRGTAELAKFMHVSKPTVSRLIKKGKFDNAYIRSGNIYWFDRNKIRKMLEKNIIFNG